MIRTRVLLGLVLTAALAFIFFSWQPPLGTWLGAKVGNFIFLFQGFAGFVGLTAIIILLFSFFRVYPGPNGELCYDPHNWFWMVMKEIFGKRWKERMSLCKSFWMTFLVILAAMCFIFTLIAIIWRIGVMTHESVQQGVVTEDLKFLGLWLGGVVVLIVVLSGIVCGCIWLLEHIAPPKWAVYIKIFFKWLGNILHAALAAVACGGFLVVMPIALIVKSKALDSWTGALPAYFMGVGGVLAAALLVWLAFRFCRALSDTWLGQVARNWKKKMCPDLVGCPLAFEPAEEEEE